MPTYTYRCGKCGRKFTAEQSLAEHDRRRTRCSHCGSLKVQQQIEGFFAQTSRKS